MLHLNRTGPYHPVIPIQAGSFRRPNDKNVDPRSTTRAEADALRSTVIAVGLVLGGIAILYLDGMTKNSIVSGPTLIATGIAWALHDRWHVTWFVLMPMLLVLLGVLMLIARRANIPERRVRQT